MADRLKKSEVTIRSRVECEEKAFHIVNRLIDDKVDGPFLTKCGQLISREHYNDVVEERAISYLCGYPLCDNRLKDIPKKQFHISTSTNKVYDISERKNFCSNQCLKASKHYSSQIPESPLWSRAKENPVEFKLLPHTGIRGIVGSEVIGISPQKLLEFEIKKLEELDLRTTPSRKTSEKQNARSPVNKTSTTDTATKEENSFKSAQTSSEGENGESDVGRFKEVDGGTDQRSFNAPHDSTATQLEETSDREPSVNARDENHESSTNMNHKRKEELIFQQKGSFTEKQEDDSKDNYNDVSAAESKQTICDVQCTEEASNTLHKNMHKISDPKKSDEETSKMDYLIELLSKRKAALSGMVEVITATPAPCPESADVTLSGRKKDKVEDLSANDVDKCKLGKYLIDQNSSQPSLNHPSTNQDSLQASGTKKSSRNKKKPSGKSKPIQRSPLKHIGAILKTWITEETTAYILSSSFGGSDDGPKSFSDPRVQRGYADLCQRLDAQQMDFEELLNETGGSDLNPSDKALKSVPDFNAIKKEAAAFELKVAEYMAGKSHQPIQKKKDDVEDDEGKDEVQIPMVDAYDQRQIRVKIVLDRLDKFLPDLLGPLHLPLQAVSTYVRELVYTFRLERDNIVFKPSEWTLVSILILKMLGKKSRKISAAFTEETALRYFSILFKGIGQTVSDLDEVTEDIISSELF